MQTARTTTDYAYILQQQRERAPALARTSARERSDKLRRILTYLDDAGNKQRLLDALHADLGKHEVEAILSEVGVIYGHVNYITKHLRRWMEPRRVATPLSMIGTSNYIYYEPKGCVLIISPWNYPFNLAIVPLLYAVAAGCTVTLKPSEHSPATTAYLQEMMGQLFAENEVAVVAGEAETSAALTRLPFNHIFFTGSPAIGKKVMAAAAENLASVTLELGGKSPCVVDDDVDVSKSARNLAWGKFFNAGQTCTAPDYLLVNDNIADRYVQGLAEVIREFYGDAPRQSGDLARIVNEKQFDHLQTLLDDAVAKGAKVVTGGTHDRAALFFAPTVLTDVTPDMRVLQEEIFGPILPILTFNNLNEALAEIRRHPKPLAFYIQANNRRTVKRLLAETSAGGTLVNEFLLGSANPALPFGGVNNSGIGKSFGFHGWVDFSNERAVLERKFFDLSAAYPPYTDKVKQLINRIYRWS
ncbi:aldehyde dehydrogenase family protein [Lewinella sp. JB7]|uniref:aldehyde dehydrogenase family protein n=1 Tax=Lewinella sp. JB7 TaxID=2962887 RepID=UPI0020C9F959|nr:aldehyde dehydrogenase family protein [Lewinella sp. JB7]MCP9237407.1 aldehyde dehydrogenase family protein [Lewinella sp. JB7]